MTATDDLRRLLDERGVEWCDDGYPTTCTVWVSNGIVWHGLWRDDCIELIAHLTPEQAIDATLGRGTCQMQRVESGTNMTRYGWRCTECGMLAIGYGTPTYCPNCGRRLVDRV